MRVGLIGAGAVSRIFYIPLLRQGFADLELKLVVDTSQTAIKRLGGLDPRIAIVNGGFGEAIANARCEIDAVIIALPHRLHAESVELAHELGLHVFCEKPLGMDEGEVRRMVTAATRAKRVLAVCHPRRSYPAAKGIKRLLELGWLGRVQKVIWTEGQPYAWPAESLAQVQRQSGGEEIFDIGAHVFDLLSWWLGPLDLRDYRDDSRGGAGAEFDVVVAARDCASINVHLSRLYHQTNEVVVECESGRILWKIQNADHFEVDCPGASELGLPRISLGEPVPTTLMAAFRDQLERFGRATSGRGSPSATGTDAMGYATLFSEIRKRQSPVTASSVNGAGRVSVVTGASGFIGSRLVERLHDLNVPIVALARRAQNCVRIARLPIDIRLSDIRSDPELASHLKGADTVYHCAGSAHSGLDAIVDGTMNVLKAAEAQQVRRVVVFSSMLSRGDPPLVGAINEDSVSSNSGMAYGVAKREMVARCLEFAKTSRVEVVILEPTCVYGPFAPDFVVGPLEQMLAGDYFFIDGGRGQANLVHVDNVIDAALLAASVPHAAGKRYLVNEDDHASTWAEYLAELSTCLGELDAREFPSISLAELDGALAARSRDRRFPWVVRNAIRSSPLAREWLSKARWFPWVSRLKARLSGRRKQRVPNDSHSPVVATAKSSSTKLLERIVDASAWHFDRASGVFFASQATYSAARIRDDLGWIPSINRREGMIQTIEWARLAFKSRLASTKPIMTGGSHRGE